MNLRLVRARVLSRGTWSARLSDASLQDLESRACEVICKALRGQAVVKHEVNHDPAAGTPSQLRKSLAGTGAMSVEEFAQGAGEDDRHHRHDRHAQDGVEY